MNIMKIIAGAAISCTVAISVWTGTAYLEQIQKDSETMYNIASEHQKNTIEMKNQLDKQQEIYVDDINGLFAIIEKLNSEIDRANEEVKSTSDFVEEQKIKAEELEFIEVPDLVTCKDTNIGSSSDTHKCEKKHCKYQESCKNSYHGTEKCCNNDGHWSHDKEDHSKNGDCSKTYEDTIIEEDTFQSTTEGAVE